MRQKVEDSLRVENHIIDDFDAECFNPYKKPKSYGKLILVFLGLILLTITSAIGLIALKI